MRFGTFANAVFYVFVPVFYRINAVFEGDRCDQGDAHRRDCVVCLCTMSNKWSCKRDICDNCKDGEVKQVNNFNYYCQNGRWAYVPFLQLPKDQVVLPFGPCSGEMFKPDWPCNRCKCIQSENVWSCPLELCREDTMLKSYSPKIRNTRLDRLYEFFRYDGKKETCQPGEVREGDECNKCTCQDGVWWCKLKQCPEIIETDSVGADTLPDHLVIELPPGMQSIREHEWDKTNKICEPGKRYKKSCNTCTCSSDGMAESCTQLDCDNFKEDSYDQYSGDYSDYGSGEEYFEEDYREGDFEEWDNQDEYEQNEYNYEDNDDFEEDNENELEQYPEESSYGDDNPDGYKESYDPDPGGDYQKVDYHKYDYEEGYDHDDNNEEYPEGNKQEYYEDNDQGYPEGDGQEYPEDKDQEYPEDSDQEYPEDNYKEYPEGNDQEYSDDNDQDNDNDQYSESNGEEYPEYDGQEYSESEETNQDQYEEPSYGEDNDPDSNDLDGNYPENEYDAGNNSEDLYEENEDFKYLYSETEYLQGDYFGSNHHENDDNEDDENEDDENEDDGEEPADQAGNYPETDYFGNEQQEEETDDSEDNYLEGEHHKNNYSEGEDQESDDIAGNYSENDNDDGDDYPQGSFFKPEHPDVGHRGANQQGVNPRPHPQETHSNERPHTEERFISVEPGTIFDVVGDIFGDLF